METIIIQNYQPRHYEYVKQIYASGQKEQITRGIQLGWRSPNVIGYLTILFIFGSIFSFYYGFLAFMFGLLFHAGSVFSYYTLYVR